jgi:hypothetical protein
MNTNELDKELVDIDKEPESWFDQLNSMFDGDVTVLEVEEADSGSTLGSMAILL